MLTLGEKREAKSAKYFGLEWGIPGKGYSPEAMVAIYRGADFIEENGVYMPEVFLDTDRLLKAMEDVSDWLGFPTTDEYLEAQIKEEEGIFKRAEKK